MQIARFPRLRLAQLPTPLHPLPRLSRLLGGPEIWVKRDDCTGMAGGGNKMRKLEFLVADAQAQGADTLITQGAVQSNHARQTAAVAASLGLACHVILEERIADTDEDYAGNGNVLLDRLFGAELQYRPGGTDMAAAMVELAEQLRAEGRRPYIIPGGGSNPVGALGYVTAALELADQAREQGLVIDCLVHGSGSAGTQAGLVVGVSHYRLGFPVLGISVRAPHERQHANVLKLARDTATWAGCPAGITPDEVLVDAGYVGPGYGVPDERTLEAIVLTARTEGVLLDPVYSGKGMAGLIGRIRQGEFTSHQRVVFLHTGGAQVLPAYRKVLDAAAADLPQVITT
ncbi:MAG: D-cysteine desulfhydrase [Gammaproteobacteria bacterium]|nr:D-cysteine desulfhydrase [Gammaproteobacteria bacterium]TVQ49998.1 MAG: D-cysteine desulfhydrase [Gammaproteobacteria bacterium]